MDRNKIGSTTLRANLPHKKVKQSRYGLDWPRGFQEVKVPRFRDNGTG